MGCGGSKARGAAAGATASAEIDRPGTPALEDTLVRWGETAPDEIEKGTEKKAFIRQLERAAKVSASCSHPLSPPLSPHLP